jgi:hypothetical protein
LRPFGGRDDGATPMNLQTRVSPGLIGTVRRFGPHGVLYEIIELIDDKRALVRVIETGEKTGYPIAKILADPTD